MNIKKFVPSNLKSLTVKQQMLLGTGFSLVLLGAIAVMSVLLLWKTKNAANTVINENQPVVINTMQLDEKLKAGLSSLGIYLLSKDKQHRKNYIRNQIETMELIAQLKNRKLIRGNKNALVLVQDIEKELEKLHAYRKIMLALGSSRRKNYPAMYHAEKEMQPRAGQVLNSIMLMINAEEAEATPRRDILRVLNEMRYFWARIMGGVRVLLGFPSLMALDESRTFFKAFDEMTEKLKKRRNELGFEQQEAFDKMLRTVKAFKTNFEYMVKIHTDKRWRQDAFLIREEINPIIAVLKKKIDILSRLQLRDIRSTGNDLTSLANVTTLIILGMLLLAMVALIGQLVLLGRRIIGPMQESVETGIVTIRRAMKKLLRTRHDRFGSLSTGSDTISNVKETFGLMSRALDEAINQQQENSEKLNDKIESILAAMKRVSAGDLTVSVEVDGEESIDLVAAELQNMMGALNELVVKIQNASIKVASSANAMAVLSKEHEATVAEQAASTNQVQATVSEISATSKELVATVTEVNTVTQNAATSATEGQEALGSMENSINHMKTAMDAIVTKLSVLNEKASIIGRVVTTINKVADQTNLLSLNAAIEAEKAGEYGRGFAVVATEIRRLADQTAVATWDIEQMVKEMQSAVSAGVMGMDKFSDEVGKGVDDVQQVGTELANIIDQIQIITPRFDTVSQGVRSQSQAAVQINESMVQLNRTAHETANALKTSSDKIRELNEAAHDLQASASRFRVRK